MSTQSPLLKKLSTRYTIMRSVEVLLIALAAGLLVWAVTDWIATDTIGRTIGVTLGAAFAALLSLMRTKILSKKSAKTNKPLYLLSVIKSYPI